MTAPSRKLVQRTIAMIVIAAMLQRIGLSPVLIVFFFVAGHLVWLVVAPTTRPEAQDVFDFYVAADEILRDEERRWYNFEIWEVVHLGERVLDWLPDAPPLVYFSLGALQHRAGDYESAVENLAAASETGSDDKHLRSAPSPALRQYVQLLREIEREPAIAPMALSAVRSLERGATTRAGFLLAESRERLPAIADDRERCGLSNLSSPSATDVLHPWANLNEVTAPRPIREVLHDVYPDEEAH